MQERDFITMKEAADIIGITYSGIAKMVPDRRIRFVKLGRENLFHRSDIDNMIEKRRARLERA